MKLKPTFFIALCLLLSACACDSDDDNIKSVALTETNYFYESDAYVYTLNLERDTLIEELENQTSNDPEAAEARINEINIIIENTVTSIGFGLPPLPPPPPICFCWDLWNEQKLLVIDDAILAFEVSITDEQQQVIYGTNITGEKFNINGYDAPVKAFSFQVEQEGYSGPATLNVTKLYDQDEEPITYSLPIFIE